MIKRFVPEWFIDYDDWKAIESDQFFFFEILTLKFQRIFTQVHAIWHGIYRLLFDLTQWMTDVSVHTTCHEIQVKSGRMERRNGNKTLAAITGLFLRIAFMTIDNLLHKEAEDYTCEITKFTRDDLFSRNGAVLIAHPFRL